MLRNTLRLNFWHLEIICILHSHYQPRIIGHILKNKLEEKQQQKKQYDYMINRNKNEDENEKLDHLHTT